MQIGWIQPAQVERRTPDLEEIRWEREKETALICEAHGFEGVYVSDHLQFGSGVSYESFSTTAALAEATSEISLSVLVSCIPFRNPALVAKAAATIDNIAKGRFKLGIGAGWYKTEFESYGYEFESAGTRVDRLEEAAELINRLWREERVSFDGDYYQTHECICEPQPIDPYLIVGGGGKRVQEIASRFADEWNVLGKVSTAMEHAPNIDGVSVSWFGTAIVSRDEEKIERITNIAHGNRTGTYIAGTPEEVVEKLKEMKNYGIDRVVLLLMDYPSRESIHLLGKEVIPEL